MAPQPARLRGRRGFHLFSPRPVGEIAKKKKEKKSIEVFHKSQYYNANLMVTTNQNPLVHTQKVEGKRSKRNTEGSHQITGKGAREERSRELGNNQKPINKMAVSSYLAIITRDVNGLMLQSKDRVTECLKTRPTCRLSTRDLLQT